MLSLLNIRSQEIVLLLDLNSVEIKLIGGLINEVPV